VTNYEAGLKTSLFDRRLSLDLAAFYIDWKDVQLSQLSPLSTTFFTNAGKATSKGFEAAADWRPIGGLEIVGNLSYLDATLETNLPGPSIGSKGDDLPTSPHWSGQLSADYQFPLSGQFNGLVGASYRFVGDRQGDFTNNPAIPRYQLPSYDVIDLRAGIKTDRWSLTGYVKNLGDSRGQVSAAALGAVQEVAVIQPRTFGLSLSADF
jgi:outer membrane receptor protein involved in Fe transport